VRSLRGLSAPPMSDGAVLSLLVGRGAELAVHPDARGPMLFMPSSCRADSLCPMPSLLEVLMQALTSVMLVLQRCCRHSWRRCRVAAAGCRGRAMCTPPLHVAAAQSAAAKCTRPLGSSSSSSAEYRNAPAMAARAAAAGAAAPGEPCLSAAMCCMLQSAKHSLPCTLRCTSE
jgi:hypothetical protein